MLVISFRTHPVKVTDESPTRPLQIWRRWVVMAIFVEEPQQLWNSPIFALSARFFFFAKQPQTRHRLRVVPRIKEPSNGVDGCAPESSQSPGTSESESGCHRADMMGIKHGNDGYFGKSVVGPHWSIRCANFAVLCCVSGPDFEGWMNFWVMLEGNGSEAILASNFSGQRES